MLLGLSETPVSSAPGPVQSRTPPGIAPAEPSGSREGSAAADTSAERPSPHGASAEASSSGSRTGGGGSGGVAARVLWAAEAAGMSACAAPANADNEGRLERPGGGASERALASVKAGSAAEVLAAPAAQRSHGGPAPDPAGSGSDERAYARSEAEFSALLASHVAQGARRAQAANPRGSGSESKDRACARLEAEFAALLASPGPQESRGAPAADPPGSGFEERASARSESEFAALLASPVTQALRSTPAAYPLGLGSGLKTTAATSAKLASPAAPSAPATSLGNAESDSEAAFMELLASPIAQQRGSPAAAAQEPGLEQQRAIRSSGSPGFSLLAGDGESAWGSRAVARPGTPGQALTRAVAAPSTQRKPSEAALGVQRRPSEPDLGVHGWLSDAAMSGHGRPHSVAAEVAAQAAAIAAGMRAAAPPATAGRPGMAAPDAAPTAAGWSPALGSELHGAGSGPDPGTGSDAELSGAHSARADVEGVGTCSGAAAVFSGAHGDLPAACGAADDMGIGAAGGHERAHVGVINHWAPESGRPGSTPKPCQIPLHPASLHAVHSMLPLRAAAAELLAAVRTAPGLQPTPAAGGAHVAGGMGRMTASAGMASDSDAWLAEGGGALLSGDRDRRAAGAVLATEDDAVMAASGGAYLVRDRVRVAAGDTVPAVALAADNGAGVAGDSTGVRAETGDAALAADLAAGGADPPGKRDRFAAGDAALATDLAAGAEVAVGSGACPADNGFRARVANGDAALAADLAAGAELAEHFAAGSRRMQREMAALRMSLESLGAGAIMPPHSGAGLNSSLEHGGQAMLEGLGTSDAALGARTAVLDGAGATQEALAPSSLAALERHGGVSSALEGARTPLREAPALEPQARLASDGVAQEEERGPLGEGPALAGSPPGGAGGDGAATRQDTARGAGTDEESVFSQEDPAPAGPALRDTSSCGGGTRGRAGPRMSGAEGLSLEDGPVTTGSAPGCGGRAGAGEEGAARGDAGRSAEDAGLAAFLTGACACAGARVLSEHASVAAARLL